MTKFLLAAALVLGFNAAHAGELDNEKTVTTEQLNVSTDLPATVVVRVKAGTNEVEVLHSKTDLSTDEATKALVSTSSFVKMDVKGKMSGELDKDSSFSSWYFCFPSYNYYYPTYYYSGYQYNYYSYYSYYYSGYYYNYYRWPNRCGYYGYCY